MEKAKYCVCKNTYCITCCDEFNCNEDKRENYEHGIGKIRKDD